MKITLELIERDSKEEILVLGEFIKEKNVKGIYPVILNADEESGTMSAGDYLPIIQLILSSTVLATGVKGIFDVLKNYFDLKKQRIISDTELKKSKEIQSKVELTIESKSGEKVNVNFSSFDENERAIFHKVVEKHLNKES